MSRPNIILILADDLGYSDLGCYGGEAPTLNLDRLGRGGVRMSQFYNTPRCSPSRAALMTGLHPHQAGIGVLTRPDLPYGYAGNLDPTRTTIAERLHDAGWTTWLSGKWHLASDSSHPNASWPTRRGFDRFFGTMAGCGSYYSPQTLTRGEEPATDTDDPDFYYTDAIGGQAAGWIDEHNASGSEQPFFLYLAFTAPHWPLHAKPSDIEQLRGAYDEGWDVLRERRLRHLVDEGLITADTELSGRDPSQPAWKDESDKSWQASRIEVYSAQLAALDRAVGTVLDAVDRAGIGDDTLVLFISDNGGCAEELPIGAPAEFATKDRVLREGTRDGRVVRPGNQPDITPGPEDTYASYGVAWANLSNTPMRLYKRWTHEGGISSPFIAWWPAGGLEAKRVIKTPFHIVDIAPTILDAAGVEAEGLEGRSMLAALRGEPVEPVTLYWEHIGNCAIRKGGWKLVRDHPGNWELYDIEADRTELHDLVDARPDLVTELEAEWRAWADRVGVKDWDDMVARHVAAGLEPYRAEE